MKKIIALLLIVSMLLAFSGCSLNLFSVESLLSPPSQSGKNGEVQKAFNELMKDRKLQLKTPVSGDYQTSFVLTDINNDNIEEAFVFYSDSSSIESSVRLAYMENHDDEWQITSDIKGAGNGVYDVNFVDLNGDNTFEVVVSWSLLDSKNQIVTIFELVNDSNNVITLNAIGNEYCNAKHCIDFDSDGNDDLVLVYLDDTGAVQKSFIRMFTLSNEHRLVKYGETVLDSTITSVSSISDDVVKTGDKQFGRVFVDCVKNERMIFTEVVYWDNRLAVPVRQYTQPAVTNLRNSAVRCMDIDNDGLLEVPSLTQLYGDEKTFTVNKDNISYTFSLLVWNNVQGDKNTEIITTLFNPLGLYLFSFPWGNNVTIKYDSLRDALVFYKWNETLKKAGDELFSISHRIKLAENEILGELLTETENGVYYYQITEEGYSFGVTDEIVNSSFIKLN